MKKNVLIDNSHKSLLQKVKMFLLDLIGKPKWSIDCDDSNQVCVGKCAVGLQFVIRIRGRNNKVSIGQGCSFNKNNIIFIQGGCNTVCIGNDVVFDQQVSVIAAEGTSVSIGDDCLFAKGVQLRTSDQHLIMNSDKVRVNEGKSICVGKHAWIGADVMICKGGGDWGRSDYWGKICCYQRCPCVQFGRRSSSNGKKAERPMAEKV